MAPFVRPRTTNHPFPPDLPVTRELVVPASLQIWPYKILPSTKIFLTRPSFFFFYFFLSLFLSFIFISHFFRGLAGAFVNPEVFFKLFFCTFTCLSNNSLISSWISAKFVSALFLCMLYLSYYFQPEVNT